MELIKIISAVKDREPWAQKRIVEDYSPFLLMVARRYTRNAEDAKDVLQDALVLIINHIHKYRVEEGMFKAWIKKICINVALGKKRKKSYTHESYPGELKSDFRMEPVVINRLNIKDIIALMRFLPELQRNVFNLYIIDGFKHREIAGILTIGESTSRTTLTRARRKMQALIIEQDKVRIDESLG